MYNLQKLDYTEKTEGWIDVLLPFWSNLIDRQRQKVEVEVRKSVDGKNSRVQYEQGILDGMRSMYSAPQMLRKGVKQMRAGQTPSEG